MKKYIIFTITILIGIFGYFYFTKNSTPITSFEECVAAGNPVMEIYPEKCTSGGKTYTRNIGNQLELTDLIQVTSPLPGETLESPLTITGQARGNWFFEGSFPIRLEDEQGSVLVSTFATAKGEWMTNDFVSFSTTFEFIEQDGKAKGQLVLQKDNPSDNRQLDNQLVIPIKY